MDTENVKRDKLVLDDILTKSPLEILEIIKVKQEKIKIEGHTVEPDVVREETPLLSQAKPIKITKSILKGKFAPGTVFTKGERHAIGDACVFEVIGVENSSGRVRFAVYSTPLTENPKPSTVLSLSIAALTGQKETFPYKKGDHVSFNNENYVIRGINPASKNVVLEVDSKMRYVKISKIHLTVPETEHKD